MVTADTLLYTADNTIWPTADGGAGNVVSATVIEAYVVSVSADTTAYLADNTIWPTADGGIATAGGATDTLDAEVAVIGAVVSADVVEAAVALDSLDAAIAGEIVAVPVGGARYRQRRPLPVYGVGYGILSALVGEAHGIVGVAGKSAARLLVRAAAVGASGQAGDAAAVLKALSVAGTGAVGTRGTGSGMIVKFSGTATGQHDDDEAAVIAFLLAA